jgi:hypothetical protein
MAVGEEIGALNHAYPAHSVGLESTQEKGPAMPKTPPVITSTPPDVVTRRSVPLTQDQLDLLRELAREGRRTLSAQMSMLLTEALDRQAASNGRKKAPR